MKYLTSQRLISYFRYPSLRRLFSIQTHLTNAEKIALYNMSNDISKKRATPPTIVEIGAYLGASSAFLAAGLENRGGQVLCIDTWNNDAMSEGGRDTMREFLDNTHPFENLIKPIRGWSTERKTVNHIMQHTNDIDILFIDGDHSYEGVLADWNAYSQLLASNAIVAMHDIGWADGVKRVVAEHVRPRVVRERQLPNLWWGWLGK